MGLFDDYFNPQQYATGRGLTGLLESLQQQQAYQPGAGSGGWPQIAPAAGRGFEAASPQPSPPQAIPEASINRPMPFPAGTIPIPTPRPTDLPSGSIAIGNYPMPQFGATQVAPHPQGQPDIGDRLIAGFNSWAYTPVGNPFAALANAITGLSSGRFTAGPELGPRDGLRSRSVQSQDDAIVPPASPTVPPMGPATRAPPTALARRGLGPRRQ